MMNMDHVWKRRVLLNVTTTATASESCADRGWVQAARWARERALSVNRRPTLAQSELVPFGGASERREVEQRPSGQPGWCHGLRPPDAGQMEDLAELQLSTAAGWLSGAVTPVSATFVSTESRSTVLK